MQDRSTEISLRLELIQAYDQVLERIDAFKQEVLSDAALPAWVYRTKEEVQQHLDHREKAAQVIGLTTYLDEQKPKESITCPGWLGASKDTIESAEKLNEAKNRFQSAVLALKGYKVTFAEPYLRDVESATTITSETLKESGLARLHLKQIYRNIPVLDEKPVRIGFTWANTRSIKKVTAEEAAELLKKLGDDFRIITQLKSLDQLHPDEALAIVHDTATHVRANIVWQESHEPRTKMIGCPLPILIPMSETDTPPSFSPVSEKKDRVTRTKRKSRTDIKLEPKPFLPAIHAYRYLTTSKL